LLVFSLDLAMKYSYLHILRAKHVKNGGQETPLYLLHFYPFMFAYEVCFLSIMTQVCSIDSSGGSLQRCTRYRSSVQILC